MSCKGLSESRFFRTRFDTPVSDSREYDLTMNRWIVTALESHMIQALSVTFIIFYQLTISMLEGLYMTFWVIYHTRILSKYVFLKMLFFKVIFTLRTILLCQYKKHLKVCHWSTVSKWCNWFGYWSTHTKPSHTRVNSPHFC